MSSESNFLHNGNCKETQEDFNKMQEKIKENYNILELRDENEDTPLINAILCGHESCIKFLIQNGANINGHVEGTNALHRTYFKYQSNENSRQLFIKVLNILLKNGSNPNYIRRSNGRQESSLLTKFVMQNDFELALLLLKYGAYPYLNTENCNMNVRFVKTLFLRHGKLSLEIKNNNTFISYLLQYKFPNEIEMKLKSLNILHKFGINLWKNEIEYHCDSKIFTSEVKYLRENPMSLKYLSRIAILQAMDTKFLSNYSKLEIPKELVLFLEFNDV